MKRLNPSGQPQWLAHLVGRTGITNDTSDPGFGIDAEFVGTEAILKLRGEVDLSTAPELGVFLDRAIDRGTLFVVLDLADLKFMDGSGLRVIGTSAKRLVNSGGALTIRSPSVMVSRLLDIVGLAEFVRIERPELLPETPGLQQTHDDLKNSTATDRSGFAGILGKVATVPSNDELVNSVLRLVVAIARATIGGADGVSVSLRRHGRLSTVAASDQIILDMDASQYGTGEGPCVDASMSGHGFHAESLDRETRWPSFTPMARALGINAILSSPLQSKNSPVGALNIYSRTPSAFAVKDQDLASLIAREASLVLSDVQADVTDRQIEGRFAGPLRTREIISQAQGVMMERDGIDEESAYTALRRLSLIDSTPLRDRAQDTLDSVRRHPVVTTERLSEHNDG
jgi:anti-anti-sigma factor